MPIQLTTPYNPGDADPGQTYPRVMITSFTASPVFAEFELVCEYGDGEDTTWVSGQARPVVVHIRGADFLAMIESLPLDASEKIWDAAARVLYQYTIDQGIFSGTIV